MSLCVWRITFELDNLSLRYLACKFTFTVVEFEDRGNRRKTDVAKVVGATSSDGFLVALGLCVGIMVSTPVDLLLLKSAA